MNDQPHDNTRGAGEAKPGDVPRQPIRVMLMISSMRGGGSEQQTLLMLRHLDRARFTPHLYLLERTGDLLDQVPGDVVIHSLDDAKPNRGMYFPGREFRRQVRHLKSVLRDQSIDVIYDRTFHMSMIAGPAARSIGIPRVSTIVSPPDHALPLVETRFVAAKRRRLATAYRNAFRIIAVSRQAGQSAQRYYRIRNQTIEVIPNPVDCSAVRAASTPAPTASSNAPSVDSGSGDAASSVISLVCVGRMTTEKGHRDLLDAMIDLESRTPDQLPTIRLQLIGDGPLRSQLESLWSAAPRRHQIEFIGRVPNPAPWIAAADGLVLPSHFEGMPNVVLESMALGTPVIATRSGGTIELEQDEPTIQWAEAKSPASLAQAIATFIADPAAAAERVAAAHRLIDRCHDVSTTIRRIESILVDAASIHTASR
ncbi:Putative teichuronic acid biosynthesis glycosyltransferase TuaC [Rubripirellula lacrimiformis]|uniref:Teichuronic acid biosynthesis glycosyltransferase TuaC n=1 Tax=Rubripirellula lacrimiformis TaxID=1930273 RepID=A0A517N422_9BACT|nr:glycosyltransferase [Rubripirellula lacrimiformis]QDT01872.1 Putative teichuronic acid biosynthesis glycosyltransferase TuaC [Rubripirellula lacrimiformis]